MMKLYLKCKDATEYVSKKEEGKLSTSQSFALQFHLLICRMCRLFSKQNHFIIHNIKNPNPENYLLSNEVKQEIIEKMQNA